MDIWLRMALINAQVVLQTLVQQKKLKLSKDDKAVLAGIRQLITSLIGE